jgi:hypothetical protein
MDVSAITQAARVTTDDQGSPVVILPLSLWQELLRQINVEIPQHERIKAILKRWESEPDDTPSGWWEALDADLRANRTMFPERALGSDQS